MLNKKIFTPGPTQVHPDVLKAAIQFDTYHRSSEFRKFHLGLIEKLKSIFITNEHLHIITTSGTGAMEAAVLNFCAPGENVLFINQGRFGARWGAICKAHNVNAVELAIEYGSTAKVSDLENINLTNLSAILLTHVDTSTATITDIKNLSEYIRSKTNALIIVDAVTSIASTEFRFDDWGIDCAVSASQKGLMTQPGIAVAAFSNRALKKLNNNPMPRYYFDLRKEIKSLNEEGYTSWTPAVGLFYSLDKSCDIILKDGLENRWKKTNQMAEFFRTESVKNGFGLFSKFPSDSLTALTIPHGIPTGLLISALCEKYGIRLANGQAEMKDKIARISHMGDLDLADFKELCILMAKEMKILQS
ncbi:MAG: alanine--glyoxylate aminotransferase family protein [Ignavibacteria bacterium]|nr:alanine--glyoxylate aminotransferase family protein [Ignavibacteria bacterium]